MDLSNTLIVAAAVAGIAGLATWAWLSITRVVDELLSFDGFEGMHFED